MIDSLLLFSQKKKQNTKSGVHLKIICKVDCFLLVCYVSISIRIQQDTFVMIFQFVLIKLTLATLVPIELCYLNKKIVGLLTIKEDEEEKK